MNEATAGATGELVELLEVEGVDKFEATAAATVFDGDCEVGHVPETTLPPPLPPPLPLPLFQPEYVEAVVTGELELEMEGAPPIHGTLIVQGQSVIVSVVADVAV